MKAITSNKLFLSSSKSRQVRILAALQDPVNKELIQQLRSYLDDEYITPQNFGEDSESTNLKQLDIEDFNDPQDDSMNNNASPHSKSSDNIEVHSELDETEPKSDGESDDEDATNSADVDSSTIVSSTCINDKNIIPVDEIKGLLNSRNDTQYVNRIMTKDNELWIYYEDKINLNTVMSSVIELLNASGYTYLEFNRLARTDNAIVFQINYIDTDSKVESNKAGNIE